jgi:hypothetical protein
MDNLRKSEIVNVPVLRLPNSNPNPPNYRRKKRNLHLLCSNKGATSNLMLPQGRAFNKDQFTSTVIPDLGNKVGARRTTWGMS